MRFFKDDDDSSAMKGFNLWQHSPQRRMRSRLRCFEDVVRIVATLRLISY